MADEFECNVIKACEFNKDWSKGVKLFSGKAISESELLYYKANDGSRELYSSQVPIIFSGGLFPVLDNSLMALKIKSQFDNNCFNTLIISNRYELQIAGGIPYPSSLFSNKISTEHQLLLMNRFLEDVEGMGYDAIIFDFPKPIMKFNSLVHNGYGIYYQMLMNVLVPDFTVVSVPFDCASLDNFELINKYHLNHTGNTVDLFNLTNELHLLTPEQNEIMEQTMFANPASEKFSSVHELVNDKNVLAYCYEDNFDEKLACNLTAAFS